jgi:hypothetical protein
METGSYVTASAIKVFGVIVVWSKSMLPLTPQGAPNPATF